MRIEAGRAIRNLAVFGGATVALIGAATAPKSAEALPDKPALVQGIGSCAKFGKIWDVGIRPVESCLAYVALDTGADITLGVNLRSGLRLYMEWARSPNEKRRAVAEAALVDKYGKDIRKLIRGEVKTWRSGEKDVDFEVDVLCGSAGERTGSFLVQEQIHVDQKDNDKNQPIRWSLLRSGRKIVSLRRTEGLITIPVIDRPVHIWEVTKLEKPSHTNLPKGC